MSRASRASLSPAPADRAVGSGAGPIRLDLLANPYGPSDHVLDALAACDRLHLPAEAAADALQRRLADFAGVPAEWLVVANGIEELLDALLLWRRQAGPVVLFPPTDPVDAERCGRHRIAVVPWQRTPSFALGLDADSVADVPAASTALVASPNDPTGTLLNAQDAVRLSRACDLVVVDERHGAYSGRTLVPLVREFDNVLVLQTLETWAGLAGLPLAYAVAPPKLARDLAAYRRRDLAMGAVVAANATLDDLRRVRASVEWLRQERSRLFRSLRKLNLVRPLPSWANFLLVQVERGDRDGVVADLARRGILVHRPPQPELAPFLRVSTGRPAETDALKRALIEIAAEL